MKHREGSFQGAGGMPLYYQSWHPATVPRALLIIVHGLGEHSGRYMNVVNHLTAKGFTIYSFDHRGHGRSPGPRAHVNKWAEFREDVGAFIKYAAGQEPDLPFFLMGHSMGGNIVLDYILHHPTSHHPAGVRGVIASAPAVGSLNIPPVLAFLSRILSRLWPTLTIDTGLDARGVSRDPEVVDAYQNDPLVHGKATPRFGDEMAQAAAWIQTQANSFKPPLLMVHGEADPIVSITETRQFFDRVPHDQKQLITYEGGYHEPHNDIQHEQVVADIETWLEGHLD